MEHKFWIAIVFLLWRIIVCLGSWGEPGNGQYHIQTDEGPERYFRFQTDNGQYRKEKRLQDGTVIGTDAWIDAAGYLRQKDYIADSNGYRILKSKVIYVGHGRRIEDAIKSTKAIPAQSGVLVDGSVGIKNAIPVSSTAKPSYSTSKRILPKLGYLSPAQAAEIPPSSYLGFDHYPPELNRAPQVFVRPHSEPSNDGIRILPKSFYHVSTSTEHNIAIPSQSFEPPYENFDRKKPISGEDLQRTTSDEFPSSTPEIVFSRDGLTYSTPLPFSFSLPSTTPSPILYNAPHSSSTSSPNDIYGDYGEEQNIYLSSTEKPYIESTTLSQGVIPLGANISPLSYRKKNSRPQSISSEDHDSITNSFVQDNDLDVGYDPQYGQFDGIAITKNGFRYYLPRQYHEEEKVGPQKRAGSFGYIDPFGIRRVIYYNASPDRGFVHRKNSRYVGFNATPYDPKPL